MEKKKSQQNPEPSPTDRGAVGVLSRKEAPSPAPERGLSRNEAGEAGNRRRGTRHPNLGGGLTRTETPGKIRRMPEHLKIELDRQLSAGTFRSWRNLSKWFADNGYEISHAALHKYGQKFDRRLESIRLATEQARIVCEQFKDDDAQMQSALMRLVQTRLFEVLCAVNEKPKRIRVKKNGADCREGCAGESHGAGAECVGAGEGGDGESEMGGARARDGRGGSEEDR